MGMAACAFKSSTKDWWHRPTVTALKRMRQELEPTLCTLNTNKILKEILKKHALWKTNWKIPSVVSDKYLN